MLDLTSLGEDDTPERITQLCHDASTPFGPVAAVCVWPQFVAQAHHLLEGVAVRIAAVCNFPLGVDEPEAAAADAAAIVADGAHEVDVVFPWRAHLEGDGAAGQSLVAAVRAAVGPGTVLKVILETGELQDPELILSAARAAVAGGADFLKTSTGKTLHGASPEAVAVLLDVAAEAGERDHRVGVKVSGGVRDAETAEAYLLLADERMGPTWACIETFRFGASGLLKDLIAELHEAEGR